MIWIKSFYEPFSGSLLWYNQLQTRLMNENRIILFCAKQNPSVKCYSISPNPFMAIQSNSTINCYFSILSSLVNKIDFTSKGLDIEYWCWIFSKCLATSPELRSNVVAANLNCTQNPIVCINAVCSVSFHAEAAGCKRLLSIMYVTQRT